MSATRDPDRIFRAWLEQMPSEAPDRAIAAVLQATEATPQARAWPRIGPWRISMPSSTRPGRRRLAIAATLAAAAVVGAVLLGTGSPTVPAPSPVPSATRPPNGPLLLTYDDGGAKRFEITYPDGNGIARTLSLPTDCAALSPDGEALAYVARHPQLSDVLEDLVIARADGTEPKTAWEGLFQTSTTIPVQWSANSTIAAADSAFLGAVDRATVLGHRDGSPATVVHANPDRVLSPDGLQLAALEPSGSDGGTRLVVTNITDGNVRTVATAAAITSLTWAPDSMTLAYLAGADANAANSDIYLVRADGSSPPLGLGLGPSVDFGHLAWSPDGAMLAVIDDGESGLLRLVTPAGVETTRTSIAGSRVTWAPDSRSLLVVERDGLGTRRAIRIDVQGNRVPLADASGFWPNCPPSWAALPTATTTPSPSLDSQPTPVLPASDPSLDGPIAVSAPDGIYLVDLDGTTTRLPIDGAIDTSCPTFSPDGRLLAVHTYDPVTNLHNLSVRAADGVTRGLWNGDMGSSFHQVRWSADGTTVMLNGLAGGPSGARTFVGRSVMDQDGVLRTFDWWGGEFPGTFALSPDGSELAVVVSEGPEGPARIDIHDLALDTTRTVARGYLGHVAWSSDGATITYTAAASLGGPADLHFMNVDGSQDRIVARADASGGSGFGFMAWSSQWDRLGAIERFGEQVRVRVFDARGQELIQIGPYGRSANLVFTWAPGGDAVIFTTSARTGGLTTGSLAGGPPMIAYLDSTTFMLGLPAGTANACPLGWGRQAGW